MPSAHKTPMPKKNQPFPLTLSYAELGWLAGVFGQTRLALPWVASPLTGEALHHSQDSLAGRNLIRRDLGTGWKVDQLAAFLVQWLGTVEEYTRLEILRRGMEPVRAGLYARPGLTLLADCAEKEVEFVFLPDEASLLAELVRRLDLGFLQRGQATFTLPEPAELVRAAWRDPGPTHRLLVQSGMLEQEVTAALTWIDTLKTVTQFTSVPMDEKKPFCLFSDGMAVWVNDESRKLAGIPVKEIKAMIQRILYN